MGCSAGSLGVQAWAHEVMMQLDDAYGFDDAAVVPDSYAGVFPPDSQSQTIQDFGACDVSALDNAPELKDSCKAGTITLQEMTSYSLEHNPETPYAFLNSKSDEGQISYYIAIAATVRNDTGESGRESEIRTPLCTLCGTFVTRLHAKALDESILTPEYNPLKTSSSPRSTTDKSTRYSRDTASTTTSSSS